MRSAFYDFAEQLRLPNKDHWPTQELCQRTAADLTHVHDCMCVCVCVIVRVCVHAGNDNYNNYR